MRNSCGISAIGAENCRRKIYDEAVRLAGTEQYTQSVEMLKAMPQYLDSAQLRKYYEAFRLEQQYAYSEASEAFSALGDYKDSAEQAVLAFQVGGAGEQEGAVGAMPEAGFAEGGAGE